jgi:hypothetical protein
MMSERARKIALLLLVLAALFLPSIAIAEPLKVNNPGTGSVPLEGNWQFHLGDDKAWADPALDDSAWEQIHVEAPWGSQSHPSYSGFAWYRRRIEVDDSSAGGTKQLALLIPAAQDA